MKSINKKRIAIVLKILMDYSKDKGITNKEIISILSDEYDIEVERKTVSDDLKILIEYELADKCKGYKYYYNGSDFSKSELKILVNIIESCNFITEKKSNEFIEKIAAQGGDKLADELISVIKYHTVKCENENIFNEIEKLHNAIVQKKQVSFNYFEYDYKGNKQLRKNSHNGYDYIVNPIDLAFKNEKYYLISYLDKYKEKNITHFRIDRMEKVKILEDNISYSSLAERFDLTEHMKCTFSMFNGKKQYVTLEFERHLIDCIRDRFGHDIKIIPKVDKYEITTKVGLCDHFYGWCSSFGTALKITSPQKTKQAYKKYLEKIIINY